MKITWRSLGLIGLLTATLAVAEPQQPIEDFKTSPPQIQDHGPGPFHFDALQPMDRVWVSFHVPVTGIRGEDLTVNGAPATRVMTEERNNTTYYIFTGFREPPPGEVQVRLADGRIRDAAGQRPPFTGYQWRFRLFAPAADEDGDGLTNEAEVNGSLDPTRADTDDDGLPDPFEEHHDCLNPVSNQAHPMSYTGELLPGDDDADDDGASDLEEFRQGTDPCAP